MSTTAVDAITDTPAQPEAASTSTAAIPAVVAEETTVPETKEGTPSATPVPAPAPVNPLDALSQTDLRKRLDTTRKLLRSELERKKRLDKELITLESSIYAFEGSYLSDALLPPNSTSSAQFGNIIKGYDSYLKAPTAGGSGGGSGGGNDRKRTRGGEEARESDRMFSRSSATYTKAIEMRPPPMMEQASVDESEEDTRKKRRHRE